MRGARWRRSVVRSEALEGAVRLEDDGIEANLSYLKGSTGEGLPIIAYLVSSSAGLG